MKVNVPEHIGLILKKLIDDYGLTISDVSDRLCITRKTLSRIVNGGGAITADMAIRLELLFKIPSAESWLEIQNLYNLHQEKMYKIRPIKHYMNGEIDITIKEKKAINNTMNKFKNTFRKLDKNEQKILNNLRLK